MLTEHSYSQPFLYDAPWMAPIELMDGENDTATQVNGHVKLWVLLINMRAETLASPGKNASKIGGDKCASPPCPFSQTDVSVGTYDHMVEDRYPAHLPDLAKSSR
jgi:hypothetical protein